MTSNVERIATTQLALSPGSPPSSAHCHILSSTQVQRSYTCNYACVEGEPWYEGIIKSFILFLSHTLEILSCI